MRNDVTATFRAPKKQATGFKAPKPSQLLLMEEILHQLIGSLSHYLQGFIHSRWLAGFLPSTVFQGIGHHMSRVQLMSNCSHQDSWKVFLERSGGLEGAGKAPSSQLPVKNRGDCRLIKLGISHVPQNPISRGVG